MKKHVDTNNARPGHYGKVINKIAEKGICPFCPENISDHHKNPMEETRYWIITENMYPYKPVLNHVLVIHKDHIEHISEIHEEAWKELREIITKECKKRNIPGGSLLMRFGDTKFTGASVVHFHLHLVQSDPENLEYDKSSGLKVRIG